MVSKGIYAQIATRVLKARDERLDCKINFGMNTQLENKLPMSLLRNTIAVANG